MRNSTISKKKSEIAALTAIVAYLGASEIGAATPTTPPNSARALIEQTVVQVLGVLRDQSRTAAQRRLELVKIAHACFDFRTMARSSTSGCASARTAGASSTW
jgi:hypothetical protein